MKSIEKIKKYETKVEKIIEDLKNKYEDSRGL